MGCSFYHKDKKGKTLKHLTNKRLYITIQTRKFARKGFRAQYFKIRLYLRFAEGEV